MKTKLFPLLFLLVVAYASAQNVTIPNANFKNYLVNNSAINTNGDTEIQTNEAAVFAGEIDLASAGIITDITGIEAFTSLTELRASGKGILSANLTQNIALEILYLDRNELTTLNLSQNTNLITVDLERNQLTAIDVTSNTNLENLGIRRNNISTLDISQNTALKFLDTSITFITTIDFSANTALETYWTQDSVLTSLDLSQNPNVTYISAYNCNLTSVNIANTNNANMNVVSLYGNPNLVCIQIDAGYTPPSGYSGWSKDVTASYSDNCSVICNTNVNIPDVNFKNYLVNNTAINTNGDTEIQCTEASAFTGAIAVQNLSISDLTGIEAFVNIIELSCVNNQLTSLDLSFNTSLVVLRCANNQLTTLNLGQNASLAEVSAFNNQLTSLDVSQNTGLTNLIIENNLLASIDLSQNLILTDLYLSDNQLTVLDVSQNTQLGDFRCANNQLTTLDISQNSSLYIFGCFSNQITSLDLSSNTGLQTVLVYDNQLEYFNIANGNNTNIGIFNATNNPNLTCITVDDVAYSNANWTNIDPQMNFNVNCTLGTEEFELNNFKLYPNPTKNIVNIETNSAFEQVIVYNFLGKEIVKTNSKRIDVSRLSSGMYMIKIKSKDGKETMKRFVKQ